MCGAKNGVRFLSPARSRPETLNRLSVYLLSIILFCPPVSSAISVIVVDNHICRAVSWLIPSCFDTSRKVCPAWYNSITRFFRSSFLNGCIFICSSILACHFKSSSVYSLLKVCCSLDCGLLLVRLNERPVIPQSNYQQISTPLGISMKKYPTSCYFCKSTSGTRSMTRTHFDVVFGASAFFLCKKHQKTLQDFIDKHES